MTGVKMKGYHILVDLQGCPPENLERVASLRKVLLKAAEEAGFTVVGKSFHQFNPGGATGVILLASSHISAHSWPEFSFVALDIYSCSGKAKAKRAAEFLVKAFKPKKVFVRELERFK